MKPTLYPTELRTPELFSLEYKDFWFVLSIPKALKKSKINNRYQYARDLVKLS